MANALNVTPKKYIKLIETGNYLLIMNNIYDRDSISCISKTSVLFEDITVGSNILNLNNYMILSGEYNGTYRHHDFGIVQDPYLTNRYYFMVDNRFTNANTDMTTANTRNWIITSEEDGFGEFTVINKMTVTNYIFDKIIDIDESYIYVSAFYHNKDSNYTYSGIAIFKFDKNTGTKSSEIINYKNGLRSSANVIYKDNDYFYVMFMYYDSTDYSSGDRGYVRVLKYNKHTNEKITTSTVLTSGYKNYLAPDIQDFLKINNNNTDYFCACFYNETKFITLSFRPNAITSSNSSPFNAAYTYADESIPIHFDNKFSITKRVWIKNGHIYAAIYDEATSTSANNLSGQGIYTLEINYDFNGTINSRPYTYIGKTDFGSSKNAISLVHDENKDVLIIGYYESFSLYIYNEDTYMYEPVGVEIFDTICAGFDRSGILWYETKDYGVYCENLYNPYKVNVKFAKILYVYEDEDIHTYLTFSSMSYLNQPSVGDYILTLSNNAYFDATNDQSLKITYTGDDTIRYPLTIIGPGRITCTTQFEQTWE